MITRRRDVGEKEVWDAGGEGKNVWDVGVPTQNTKWEASSFLIS